MRMAVMTAPPVVFLLRGKVVVSAILLFTITVITSKGVIGGSRSAPFFFGRNNYHHHQSFLLGRIISRGGGGGEQRNEEASHNGDGDDDDDYVTNNNKNDKKVLEPMGDRDFSLSSSHQSINGSRSNRISCSTGWIKTRGGESANATFVDDDSSSSSSSISSSIENQHHKKLVVQKMSRARRRLEAAGRLDNNNNTNNNRVVEKDANQKTTTDDDELNVVQHDGPTTTTTTTTTGPPLKVLFLSADTGGGHRASAESLAKQFVKHYPGSTYDLADVWTKDGCLPYRLLVPVYKHLSAHPWQWKLLYHSSNTAPHLWWTDVHSVLTCERKIRRTIASYDPDVVVSVHPTTQNVPWRATRRLGRRRRKVIPFFTVVTDLGSGHGHWFHPGVDKTYVASERVRRLARRRGRVPPDKLVMVGLPIRMDFAVQARALGEDGRTSGQGRRHAASVRRSLGLSLAEEEEPEEPPPSPPHYVVLVMGGGEGVGSLSNIVHELYVKLSQDGIHATIAVVCGRNEKLLNELNTKDWDQVLETAYAKQNKKKKKKQHQDNHNNNKRGNVNVIGLGFVTNMAEYMVAADVLVSKAGPGTLAEAAAVGLPVMMTSFLPGQEAGNVDVVLDGGFGDYCNKPKGIAEEVSCWLQDKPLLEIMSKAATKAGVPDAASDIVLDMGKITHEIMQKNNQSTTNITQASL